jgi:hypothetical protein
MFASNQKIKDMKDVEVLGLMINLFGVKAEGDDTPDLGAVTLSRDGREYILDVCQSYTTEKGDTEIECDLEVDRDMFEDCAFDLTMEDLYSSDLKATFYIATELEIDKMTLFVRSGGCTKAIDLEQD